MSIIENLQERNDKEEEITKRSGQLEWPRNPGAASVGLPTDVISHKKHSLRHIRVLQGRTLRFGLRGTEWIVLHASLVIPPKNPYNR
jgi:hypothetical protein